MTRQQQRCLAFVRSYTVEHDGISPSYEEIATHLGVASRSNVWRVVLALEAQGRIRRVAGAHVRNLVVVESDLTSPVEDDAPPENHKRNTEIIRLRMLGGSSGEIADALGITRNTVCGVLHRTKPDRGPATTAISRRISLPAALRERLVSYCRVHGKRVADAVSDFLDAAEGAAGRRSELTSSEREQVL